MTTQRADRTVLLSDGYWRSRFGGDPKVLGRRILLEGFPHEIIGVLPPNFQFMDREISLVVPMRFNRDEVHLGNFSYQGVARLKPGVTLAQANADVARMIPLSMQKFPAPARLQPQDVRGGPRRSQPALPQGPTCSATSAPRSGC